VDRVVGRAPGADEVVTFDEVEVEITRVVPATIDGLHELARRARARGLAPLRASKYATVLGRLGPR